MPQTEDTYEAPQIEELDVTEGPLETAPGAQTSQPAVSV